MYWRERWLGLAFIIQWELTAPASNVQCQQVNHCEHLMSWKLYLGFCRACNTGRLEGCHSNHVTASDLLPCTAWLWRFSGYLLWRFEIRKQYHDKCRPSERRACWNATSESGVLNANGVLFCPSENIKNTWRGCAPTSDIMILCCRACHFSVGWAAEYLSRLKYKKGK